MYTLVLCEEDMQDKKYNENLGKYFKLDTSSPSGLRWIAKYGKKGSTIKIGDVVGSLDKKDGYWRIHALGSHYKAHKVVWAMNNGYQKGLEIDRFPDNNGPYSPENCRFATKTQNARNKRNNHYLTYNGETNAIGHWCETYNIPRNTLKDRLYRQGMDIHTALTTPINSKFSQLSKRATRIKN